MGYLIQTEIYGQGNNLEESFQVNSDSWKGIWDAVEAEMDRTDRIPSGMEGWEEGGCALTENHDCAESPEECHRHLKDAIRDWIKSAWEHDELRTGSFFFAGPDWSSITFTWDGN